MPGRDPTRVSRVTPAEGRAAATGDPLNATDLMRHGSMSLEYYAPRGRDPQQPHRQDELYVVISGSGTFMRAGERVAFGPGDVLFAAAGEDHRFEAFTEDFATWVIFYGPDGGESPG